MKQRLLTAIIGIIIVVPIILYGNWPFLLIAYTLATIALYELVRMYSSEKKTIYLLISFLFLWLMLYPDTEITVIDFSLTKFNIIILFTVVLLIMTVLSKNRFSFDHAGFLLLATVYVGTAFYYMLVTRL